MNTQGKGKEEQKDEGIGRREQEIIGGILEGKIICLFNFIVSFLSDNQ